MSETIADIKAWLRRPIEGENAYLTLWRNEIADRIEAAENQSVTNCNRLGNAARMREALEKADAVLSLISKSALFIDANFSVNKAVIEAVNAIEDALSVPPRNCDVGKPEEQAERFQWFCDTRPCDCCTLKNKVNETLDCAIHWAQMPYKEGENKDIKK